jgi:ribosomal protein L44E
MTKKKIEYCDKCKEDTWHRVKHSYGKGKDGRGFLKYKALRCLQCNYYRRK